MVNSYFKALIKTANEHQDRLDSFGLRHDHELACLWQTLFSLEKLEMEDERDRLLTATRRHASAPVTATHRPLPLACRGDHQSDDGDLEDADPNPDIDVLVDTLNDKYLGGRLPPVLVKWSNRLTYTAGYTRYDGRTASIVLSAPLLSLRSRKDLIDTLLHEMIHALLFYQGKTDHIDHGPSFVRWMRRVNKRAGTSITPYHNYHEQVDFLRQHWWRCDGRCTLEAPYFGLVRRAIDRAPSAQDRWWCKHQRECGGTFHKVKSPSSVSGKTWTRRLLKKRSPKIRFKKTMKVYPIPSRQTRSRLKRSAKSKQKSQKDVTDLGKIALQN